MFFLKAPLAGGIIRLHPDKNSLGVRGVLGTLPFSRERERFGSLAIVNDSAVKLRDNETVSF